MAKEKFVVTGEQRDDIDGQMMDVKRQLRLKKGSPLDPELVKIALQNIVEGKFEGISKEPIHDFSNAIYRYEIRDYYQLFEVNTTFTKHNKTVKFSFIDPNFTKLFGNKIEDGGSTIHGDLYNCKIIYFRNLLLVNPIQTIYKELGGEDAVFRLRNIYHMLERHRNSLDSRFLVNGDKNYFFALDVNNEIQLLCFWRDINWAIKVVSDFKSNKKVLAPAQFLSFRS